MGTISNRSKLRKYVVIGDAMFVAALALPVIARPGGWVSPIFLATHGWLSFGITLSAAAFALLLFLVNPSKPGTSLSALSLVASLIAMQLGLAQLARLDGLPPSDLDQLPSGVVWLLGLCLTLPYVLYYNLFKGTDYAQQEWSIATGTRAPNPSSKDQALSGLILGGIFVAFAILAWLLTRH